VRREAGTGKGMDSSEIREREREERIDFIMGKKTKKKKSKFKFWEEGTSSKTCEIFFSKTAPTEIQKLILIF
jgi:hypothetical protein